MQMPQKSRPVGVHAAIKNGSHIRRKSTHAPRTGNGEYTFRGERWSPGLHQVRVE